MFTRALIAVRTGPDLLRGVYHHYDGYPAGLGRALYEAYYHFDKGLRDLLEFLIEQHPAGWSNIVDTDLSLPAGYIEHTFCQEDFSAYPMCYCHGDRSVAPAIVENSMSVIANYDYSYVFDLPRRVMQVFRGASFLRDVPLDLPAPDWKRL